jgi:hypothetical protein
VEYDWLGIKVMPAHLSLVFFNNFITELAAASIQPVPKNLSAFSFYSFSGTALFVRHFGLRACVHRDVLFPKIPAQKNYW